MRQIKLGEYDMKGKIWNTISKPAKDLITKMMCVDPKQRLSAI